MGKTSCKSYSKSKSKGVCMRNYILLFCGITILIVSFIGVYLGFAPRVGPIGNGPNEQLIWFRFVVQFLSGLCTTTLGVISIRRENKKRDLL